MLTSRLPDFEKVSCLFESLRAEYVGAADLHLGLHSIAVMQLAHLVLRPGLVKATLLLQLILLIFTRFIYLKGGEEDRHAHTHLQVYHLPDE